MRDLAELKTYLLKEEQQAFAGWDFSYLDGRWETGAYAWDYRTVIDEFRRGTDRLLDMGTGDGAFLLSLGHPCSQLAVTEGWEPNLKLCRERLEPLVITVKAVAADNVLAFDDGEFDLVINRHEDFDVAEVYRVLKPGGYFVTQQVGGRNSRVLIEKLMGDIPVPFPDHDLQHNVDMLEARGFVIRTAQEAQMQMKLFDLGAVVYMAKQLPWEYPDFSVERCFQRLVALGAELEEHGYIDNVEERFVIAAQKLA